RSDSAQLGFGLRGRLLGGNFPANAMNAAFGNAQRLEQEFMGCAEIALRIGRWDAPFISPEKIDASQFFGGLRGGGKSGEQFSSDAAAGEGEAIRLLAGQFGEPLARGGFGELLIGRELN